MSPVTGAWRVSGLALLLWCSAFLAGCDPQTAMDVQARYASERWIHRAALKHHQAEGRGKKEQFALPPGSGMHDQSIRMRHGR
jgi:hypothetical protein